MLVGEQSPAPRVVAGLRKLRPELTPGPIPTPVDPDFRISGVLRQYYNDDTESWAWVRAAVRSGCLLAWRDGTLPRRAAARLPLRDLHLRTAHTLPNAFQLSRLRDDSAVATFQTCNAAEYARWVRALCVEILGQTPLPQVRFLDVLPAADTASREPKKEAPQQETPSCPPKPPPRARRRLLTSTETQLTRRDHSPAATDEGIVVEDDDYDSSSDRSLDLTLSLDALKTTDVVDAPVRKAEVIKCDSCSKLNAGTQQHHTLPRAARSESEQGRRYLKRWEGTAGGAERGRFAMEAARRKTSSLEHRARSCSPNVHEAIAQYVPVRERRALFESLSRTSGGLARSSEQLARIERSPETTPRRAASLHDLQAPPTRSVSDLRQFFEAVARGAGAAGACAQRHSAPHYAPRAFTSLTCA
ncbi:uncharacterized protein LOC110383027 [Helicoverpa armigera]|uniref:PH domain-containing protein n=1 Tax=Helicoverpa armigera TaxID=29058 RepID=A0A2W1B2A0_HELAM|nr:uncharacterized protein LOC124638780 [Helicoverpa zea]PZC70932.1 hypothetical protein B5X24_HaOG214597 [Helicoverpa armigera]